MISTKCRGIFLAIGCLLAATLACALPGFSITEAEVAPIIPLDDMNAEVRATEAAYYDQFTGAQQYNVTNPKNVKYDGDCQYAHETKGTPRVERKFVHGTGEALDRIVLTDTEGSYEYLYTKPYTFCRSVPGRNNTVALNSECVILYEHGFSIVVNPFSGGKIDETKTCNRLDYAEVNADDLVLTVEEEATPAPAVTSLATAECIAPPDAYQVEFRKEEQHGKDDRYNCMSFMTVTNLSSDPLWIYYYADHVTINNPRYAQWVVKKLEPGGRIEPLAINDFAAYYMSHPSGIEYLAIGPLVAVRDLESCRGITPETEDLSSYTVDLDSLCPTE